MITERCLFYNLLDFFLGVFHNGDSIRNTIKQIPTLIVIDKLMRYITVSYLIRMAWVMHIENVLSS